jgi:hypothetical protein
MIGFADLAQWRREIELLCAGQQRRLKKEKRPNSGRSGRSARAFWTLFKLCGSAAHALKIV